MAAFTIWNLELAGLHGGDVKALVILLSRLVVAKGNAVDLFQGLSVDRPLLLIHDHLFRRDGLRLLPGDVCVALHTGEIPVDRAVKWAGINEHGLVVLGCLLD
jgi:hypothetical protein